MNKMIITTLLLLAGCTVNQDTNQEVSQPKHVIITTTTVDYNLTSMFFLNKQNIVGIDKDGVITTSLKSKHVYYPMVCKRTSKHLIKQEVLKHLATSDNIVIECEDLFNEL